MKMRQIFNNIDKGCCWLSVKHIHNDINCKIKTTQCSFTILLEKYPNCTILANNQVGFIFILI